MFQKIFFFIICILINLWSVKGTAANLEGQSNSNIQLIKYIRIISVQNRLHIDKQIILQAIQSQPGSEYDEKTIQEDQKRIAKLYRARYGYFQTKSTVSLTQNANNQGIVITFSIDEGIKARVGGIFFEGDRFDGDQIVDDITLMEQIKTKEKQEYNPKTLDDDVKQLEDFYKKYDYLTVKIPNSNVKYISSENEVVITISITKGPKVIIQFDGNDHIKDKHLLEDLPLLERGNISRFTLNKSVAAIKEKYRKKGYYLVKVTYERIKNPPQKVIVKFHIDEGKPIYIADIEFKGISKSKERELHERMATKPRSRFASIPILRQFFEKGIYDENVFWTDIYSLNLYYQQQGYHQVNIKKIEPEIRKGRIYLTIPIDEGTQLRVKKINIEFIGEHSRSEDEIKEKLTTKEGSPYNPDTLFKDEIYLRGKYRELGYVYADIKSSFDNGVVTFKINEKKRYRLGKIRFFGNEKTKSNVLRREFLLKEGDWFDTTKTDQTQQRLYALGLFSSVLFETRKSAETQKNAPFKGGLGGFIDVLVRLRERPMNSFNLSGGYNPSEGPRGSVETSHRNLFGRGQKLSAKLTAGTRGNRYDISFLDPWLLGTRTRSSIRIFRENLEERDGVVATGGGAQLTRDVKQSSIGLEYQYQLLDQSKTLKKLGLHDGKSTISSVELSFNRDVRNPFWAPRKGWLHEINLKFAGGPLLRGDDEFVKLSTDIRYYHAMRRRVIALALRTGYARGKSISSLERFQAGGSTTVRGYPERSLGPTDELNPQIHRGNIKLIFNAELRFPIYEHPRYPRIDGAIFFDTGNVWNSFSQIPKTQIYSSVGVGLRIEDIPIGPIRLGIPFRLDYGYPLKKGSPQIHIALGHAF